MSTSVAGRDYGLNEYTFRYIKEGEDKIRAVPHQVQQFVL
jgi:hypothetical protein